MNSDDKIKTFLITKYGSIENAFHAWADLATQHPELVHVNFDVNDFSKEETRYLVDNHLRMSLEFVK